MLFGIKGTAVTAVIVKKMYNDFIFRQKIQQLGVQRYFRHTINLTDLLNWNILVAAAHSKTQRIILSAQLTHGG